MLQSMLQKVGSENVTSLTIMSLRMGSLVAKFALTIFIARFLGLADLGTYGLITGVTVVLPVILSLGQMNILAREAVDQKASAIISALRDYWGLMVALYLALVLLGSLLGLVINFPFSPKLMLLVMMIVFLEHLSQDTTTLFINLQKPLMANIFMFLRSGGWAVFFMILAFFIPAMRSLNVLLEIWLLFLLIAISIFIYLTRDWPWASSLSKSFHMMSWLGNLKKSGVLYISDVSNAAGLYIDRYILSLFLGLELTGVYVLFWQVGNAIYSLINTGLLQMFRPVLIKAFNRGDEKGYWKNLKKAARRTLLPCMAICLVTSVVFPYLMPYLEKPLAQMYLPLLWLILGGLVIRTAADIPSYILYTRRYDKSYTLMNVLLLGTSTVLNLLLLPWLGIYGAAIAMFGSFSLLLLTRTAVVHYMLKRPAA